MHFRSLRKPIATILMLLMMSPVAINTFPQPAAAATPVLAIIGVFLGVVGAGGGGTGIGLNLVGSDKEKRAQFTQRMIADLNREYPNYNAVITHHKSSRANGPGVVHDHVELPMSIGTKGYEIFMSPKGQPFKFELNGDGGYLNWAYGGDFHRQGSTLTAR